MFSKDLKTIEKVVESLKEDFDVELEEDIEPDIDIEPVIDIKPVVDIRPVFAI